MGDTLDSPHNPVEWAATDQSAGLVSSLVSREMIELAELAEDLVFVAGRKSAKLLPRESLHESIVCSRLWEGLELYAEFPLGEEEEKRFNLKVLHKVLEDEGIPEFGPHKGIAYRIEIYLEKHLGYPERKIKKEKSKSWPHGILWASWRSYRQI